MKKLLLIMGLSTLLFTNAQADNWYDNLIFKDPSFIYEFVRTIGYTYTGGADIGEAIMVARQIPDRDINQWYNKWLDLADQLFRLGDNFAADKNLTSSQEAYLRASNYYRTASFYMDAPSLRPKAVAAWAHSRLAFLKAIQNIPYIRTVSIPYQNIKLPGYFIQSKIKNAPLLIVNTGFDGTAEELYFAVGQAAHRRGYHVLLVEGPGQGGVIKQENRPFRYDWEKVITPVIDYCYRLPDVNLQQIALMGLSMGGYLTARAAAFEPRIKALILNGGVYDMTASVASTLPSELLALVKTNPTEFNKYINQAMNEDVNANWFFNNAMWVFGVKTPAEVMNTLVPYNLGSVIDKIKCQTLVIDSVDDTFFRNQPQHVYQLLKAPKTLLVFTRAEAAQAHCQVGAMAISNERVFSWLDQAFNWHPKMIN